MQAFQQLARACLVTLPLVQLVAASPLPDPDLHARQGVNCSDLNPAASFDDSCWGVLDLSDWLSNPKTGWNATTPVCTDSEDGTNCCEPDEPWTTCFLRLAHGNSLYDCSQINVQSCADEGTLSPYLSPSIVPQTRYVMKNIYGIFALRAKMLHFCIANSWVAINNFFTNWFNALPYAISQAGLMVTPVVKELDSPSDTNVVLNFLLTALGFGLSVIGGPEIDVGVDGILAGTVAAGSALAKGLVQAPGIAKAIWPTGTDDTTTV